MTNDIPFGGSIPRSFNCPHCGAFAFQELFSLGYWSSVADDVRDIPNWEGTRCYSCEQLALWHHKRRVYPLKTTAAMPNPDMPESVKVDFEEARAIADLSPRGAAALLRLSIQKLCIELGQSGKNLNADIAALVRGGLDDGIQKALDIVRVTGNHSVHPGELDVSDKPEQVHALFGLINEIVEQLISKPKRLDALYDSLPVKDRESIHARNERAKPVEEPES